MNLSIQDELQLFAEELYQYFTPSFIEELARELNFVNERIIHVVVVNEVICSTTKG
ncbi:hypothetical protein ACFDTO_21140 [Microbacteriaceae bacterium 4G12]